MNHTNKLSLILLWSAGLFANASGWLFTLLANRHLSLIEMGNLGFYTNLIALVSIGSVAIAVTTNRFQALAVTHNKLSAYGYAGALGKIALLCGLGVFTLYIFLAPWWTVHLDFPLHWSLLVITGMAFLIMFPIAWLRSVLQAHAFFSLVGTGLFLEGIAKVALGLLATSATQPFFWFMSAMTFSSLAALLSMWLAKKKLVAQVVLVTKTLKKEHWLFMSQTLLQRIGVVSLLTIDVLAAKYFLVPQEAGVYALLSLSGKVIFFLTQSLYVLVTPLISPYLKQDSKRRLLFGAMMATTAGMGIVLISAYVALPRLSLGLMLGERYHLILPYIARYSVASGLLSLVLIAALYKLLRQQYLVSALVLVGLGIEAGLMMRFHQSLNHLVNNVLWSAVALTVLLVMAFGYQIGVGMRKNQRLGSLEQKSLGS